ncbi:molecular chaperone DnaJ [Deinococcus sp.]|uniref:molecular chaperone DnaJ n=1 Tax=Deinococcus sp. TaxID=47478 RepID=UPI003C7BB024
MDYYELLGVAKTADADEIKSAYRKLALKFHPDRNKEVGAAEQFSKINEAYAVLSDPEKRAHFDRFGQAPGTPGMPGDPFGGQGFDPMDIFEQLFGGGMFGNRGGRRGPARGDDLETELHVSLEQAREGAEVQVEVDRLTTCEHCHGNRSEPGGRPPKTCPTCSGSGVVGAQARTIFGNVMTQQPCPTCRGEGVLIEDPCTVCRGRGRTLGTEQVTVKLPKGIDEGYRIRVSGMGHEGPGGPGDLYAHIEMEPHPELRREAEHLIYVARLPYPRMVLGGKVSVPTLDGLHELEVKAGTQHGEMSRLRGQGMPRLQASGTGDLVVVFEVDVPKPGQLSAEAKSTLSEYAAHIGDEVHEHRGGFFEKIGKVIRGE